MKTSFPFSVNASIQAIPIGTDQPMPLIDEAISLIRESGFPYEVGPFSTSVEAPMDSILGLLHQIRERLHTLGGTEILIQVQFHSNAGKNVKAEEKTLKFRRYGEDGF